MRSGYRRMLTWATATLRYAAFRSLVSLGDRRAEGEPWHLFEGLLVTFAVGPDLDVVPGLAGVQAVPDGLDEAPSGVPVCLGAGVTAHHLRQTHVPWESISV